MSIEQALTIIQTTQVIHSHSLHQDNVETGQRTTSHETHGGHVDFPFVMALISIIFTKIIEPGAGDCTFSITIWIFFHYLFRSIPRLIAMEIDPTRHLPRHLSSMTNLLPRKRNGH